MRLRKGGREILRLSTTTREYIFFLVLLLFWKRRRMMIVFLEREKNDRVRLRGLFNIFV